MILINVLSKTDDHKENYFREVSRAREVYRK